MRRPVVLLDRDGTLIVERHYLSDPRDVELLPHVGMALRQLHQLGLGLVLITNQSAIRRGMFDEARLREIHERLEALLAEAGVRLDGIYHCPHAPDDRCVCRKPQPGLVERASHELGFDPETSFVIGDKRSDVELGQRIGATTFLVRTGYGAQVEAEHGCLADYSIDSLADAVPIIAHVLRLKRSRIASVESETR